MLPTSPRLSPAAYELLGNPTHLGQLVIRAPGDRDAYARLSAMDPSALITGALKDPDMASAVASGLWLWLGHLDEAHRLAQKIETPTGAFWHAIMHRLEGDFSNSKYWLARCGEHPARQAIANNVALVLNDLPADKRLLRLTNGGWNAEYLVDLAQQYHQRMEDPFAGVVVTIQQIEWRVLIEYCASSA